MSSSPTGNALSDRLSMNSVERSALERPDGPPELWDEAGHLILKSPNRSRARREVRESPRVVHTSVSAEPAPIPLVCELGDSGVPSCAKAFIERQEMFTARKEKKQKQARRSAMTPVKHMSAASRRIIKTARDRSPPKRAKTDVVSPTSYMSKESRRIVASPRAKSPRKGRLSEDEFTFRPDLRRSLNYPVSKGSIPLQCAEAHLMKKDIWRKAVEIEVEAEILKACTFEPDREAIERDRHELVKRNRSRRMRVEKERQTEEEEDSDELTE